MDCKNCKTEVGLNYCPKCGQAVKLPRINGHYIIHEIEHVIHFEKGILYTIRGLLTKPGENVRHFVTEDRSRLVKPIIFIILTSLIYTLINHAFHIEEEYVKFYEERKSTIGLIFKWVQNNYGYANILMGIFIAFWLKVFFRKYNYNFFEILILLCFVMGIGMLIYAVFALFQGITHYNLTAVGGVIGIAYCSWSIGQFFDQQRPVNFIKACGGYLLGMISFMLTVIVLGSSIDLIIHS